LFTYLLGLVTMEELRSATPVGRDTRQAAARFRSGLDVIIAGIRASAVW
jgi:TetR/AcrR family transcriptional regulator, tetracycline repressor protein